MDLDLVWHSSEARVALVPSMLVKDRSLQWMVVRSQTSYPEHILVYGRGKTHCSLVMGSGSFWIDLLEAGMVEV